MAAVARSASAQVPGGATHPSHLSDLVNQLAGGDAPIAGGLLSQAVGSTVVRPGSYDERERTYGSGASDTNGTVTHQFYVDLKSPRFDETDTHVDMPCFLRNKTGSSASSSASTGHHIFEMASIFAMNKYLKTEEGRRKYGTQTDCRDFMKDFTLIGPLRGAVKDNDIGALSCKTFIIQKRARVQNIWHAWKHPIKNANPTPVNAKLFILVVWRSSREEARGLLQRIVKSEEAASTGTKRKRNGDAHDPLEARKADDMAIEKERAAPVALSDSELDGYLELVPWVQPNGDWPPGAVYTNLPMRDTVGSVNGELVKVAKRFNGRALYCGKVSDTLQASYGSHVFTNYARKALKCADDWKDLYTRLPPVEIMWGMT